MATQAPAKPKAGSKMPLSAEQQERAAAFVAREKELAGKAATTPPTATGGTGSVTYNLGMWDPGTGFAELGWSVAGSLGQYVIAPTDWVGVFASYNQALVNPYSNYLGGNAGWTWASGGGPFVTNVPLQPNQVAAYVIKNAAGKYVAVCITAPWDPD